MGKELKMPIKYLNVPLMRSLILALQTVNIRKF